ncbi:Asp-tRNA(Asn)/Glu-tRNA(Gln) amidotransferase subunit GatB, partial [Candidatus Gottesmanbacteria bacterium]|nr:Asp-tRNA(Asn)/Glu-tRNA(Gln) amidotransferase subunit GatB [Candidatus Gottesmanbacteria bacterium]
MDNYTPVIGLEIHVELKTKSKMFCRCKNDPFFAGKPNIYTCPVCLGLPGALPVPNRKAVEWTILLGLALGCTINENSKFDRKHYFYPDLPKGYQISQYDQPLAIEGSLGRIRIRRVHLEEDTGKLIHSIIDGKAVTLVDFNRSGVPLVEIVTEPDIMSGEEAKIFLKNLQQIVRYLGISDADMEKGSMRLEPNISVRAISSQQSAASQKLPDYKVEVKNINSFNFVKRAIEYEVARHVEVLKQGKTPAQETRGWNETKGITVAQRTKEEAADYRYFPEPDIPPMKWGKSQITNLKSQIGELPDEKKTRFMKGYELNEYDASIITETKEKAEYFEEAAKVNGQVTPKTIANWMINRNIDINEVLPVQLIERIIKAKQVTAVSDDELEKVIMQVISENQKA